MTVEDTPAINRTVYVRLITNPSLASRIICWYTWSNYSHVEFITPGGYLGALVRGGVQLRPFDYCNPTRELWLKGICPTFQDATNVNLFARAQIGKSYNIWGIVDFAVHDVRNTPNTWFCSQLVANSFYKGNYPLFNGTTFYKLTPRDIELSPRLQNVDDSDIARINQWKYNAGVHIKSRLVER